MVKVRFAPSPTGYLHIGGARTALFNWLFARHNKGKFILRIEDTDQERNSEESVKAIFDSMKWIGLDWDEGPGKEGESGPYFQTQRLEIYRKYVDKLLAEKKAYKCFCTKEELDAGRKAAEAAKSAFKYDSRCSRLTDDEVKAKEAAGMSYTIRIKIPQEGDTVINDMVRGDVTFANSVLDDFIISRASGMPMYNFVVVVDDALMGITHVIRGEDHLSNTPKQVHIYKALGFPVPQFAHIPLILGADRSKLSKRHGKTSVGEYQAMGIDPHAFINFLALLGWSSEDGADVMSVDEIISKFSLERIHKAGAMFDNEKLLWMNGMYIRKMTPETLFENCAPFLVQSGLVTQEELVSKKDYLIKITKLQQEKIRSFAELPQISGYFFGEDAQPDDSAKKVFEKNAAEMKKTLEVFLAVMQGINTADFAGFEAKLREEMEKAGIKPKVFMHVIRAAVSGTTTGPGLFELIDAIGKERCEKRVKKLI